VQALDRPPTIIVLGLDHPHTAERLYFTAPFAAEEFKSLRGDSAFVALVARARQIEAKTQ